MHIGIYGVYWDLNLKGLRFEEDKSISQFLHLQHC